MKMRIVSSNLYQNVTPNEIWAIYLRNTELHQWVQLLKRKLRFRILKKHVLIFNEELIHDLSIGQKLWDKI